MKLTEEENKIMIQKLLQRAEKRRQLEMKYLKAFFGIKEENHKPTITKAVQEKGLIGAALQSLKEEE